MTTELLIELMGYFGSILVVGSMLMSSIVKLRIINLIGSSIFSCYGFIIHSYPIAFMNLCLAAINIYNLVKLTNNDKNYHL